jgi:hypothetical protein
MNIPDHFSESLETVFRVKNTSGSGIRNLFDTGSGMEKFGSGINTPDPQQWWQVEALPMLASRRVTAKKARFPVSILVSNYNKPDVCTCVRLGPRPRTESSVEVEAGGHVGGRLVCVYGVQPS